MKATTVTLAVSRTDWIHADTSVKGRRKSPFRNETDVLDCR